MSLRIEALQASALPSATRLLALACARDAAAAVAEEKLFADGALARRAEPLAAYQDDTLVAVACTSDRWLRLLAVHPDHRRRGIGSELLTRCEKQIAAHSQTARVMDQPGNYLSPGTDAQETESIAWLMRRDFKVCADNCNLLIALEGNPRVSPARLTALITECEAKGYSITRQPPERVEQDALTIENEFSAGWAFEMRRAASYGMGGVHIALHRASGALAAFAAHDGNNQGLGWFGPTGTLSAHRNNGLGAALLLACLLDTAHAGHSHSQIAWIGPREFYDKVAGIAGERHFHVLTKDLSP